jgi:hypothetical protein
VLDDHVENVKVKKNIKNRQKSAKINEDHLRSSKIIENISKTKQLNKLTFYLALSRPAENMFMKTD